MIIIMEAHYEKSEKYRELPRKYRNFFINREKSMMWIFIKCII